MTSRSPAAPVSPGTCEPSGKCRRQLAGLVMLASWGLLLLMAARGLTSDWPMWRYDAGRTATSPAELPEELHPSWVVEYTPRKPVWDDPLNQDLMPYDRLFEPVVVGTTMLIGFNDSDKLVALDTRTGREKWRFYADGPVRLPPAANSERVFFASDDGHLYCLRVADGSLAWRHRGGPSERKILGNQRLISTWPARGGPVLCDGLVYYAASIWPMMGTFIYCLDATTGTVRWLNDETSADFILQPHNNPAFAGIAPQGALVATRDHLLIPGGRSVPACFDRKTGKLQYYHLAKYSKMGGSFVFANEQAFFGHERATQFNRFKLDTGALQKGVRGRQPVLDGEAFYFSGDTVEKRLVDAPDKKVWEIKVDASGDLVKAGQRLYAAGDGVITAIKLSSGNEVPRAVWSLDVEGQVGRLLAADQRLFAVTLSGRILAFGPREGPSALRPARPKQSMASSPQQNASRDARTILEETGVREGYALCYGVDDGDLLETLAVDSKLTIIACHPNPETVARLRQRLDRAGLYGQRISLLQGDLHSLATPPYLSSLTIVADARTAGFHDDRQSLARVFHSLRPYGGVAWLPSSSTSALAKQLESAGLAGAKLQAKNGIALLTREGPLPGAGTWTHQYGSIANTIKSDDRLVRLPLGILWFGGSSNLDVLPRHGHGPPEQIVGGRLFIEGMDCFSARDVYTGRVLWKVSLESPGTFGVYYDQTHQHTPLSTAYNQVHIPGANARGTNFVATSDRVYIIDGDKCRMLDAASGKAAGEIVLPAGKDGQRPSSWGYLGIDRDYLIAGGEFAQYSERLDLPHDKTQNPSKSKWRFSDYDKTGSRELLVMDRYSGKLRWRRAARCSFLHNAIAVANGMLYCLDKWPPGIEQRLLRRGEKRPEDYRLLAMDVETGDVRWESTQSVFGTWLSCSEEHRVLLQSTRPSKDTVQHENGTRMIAYDATSGQVLWDRAISYNTPPILHGDTIIAGGERYQLRTGEEHLRLDPLTGTRQPWTFVTSYGCNYPIASEHLLTFRSSAAGFYDLASNGGTGHFGGFKSGCTSNLIAADGVLSAPDYTRTCSCGFQNQTSLALVHMPELPIWTHNDFEHDGQRVQRVGINFGAPGDRRDGAGTLWLDYPSIGGKSPDLAVRVTGPARYYRHHPWRFSGSGPRWIAASGVEDARTLVLPVLPGPSPKHHQLVVSHAHDDAEEDTSGKVNLTSSDLELIHERTDQWVGIRFASVPLPRDSRVKHAYLQLTTDEPSSAPTTLEIRGQASDNAARFASKQKDISSRPRTNSSTSWQPEPWKTKGAATAKQRSPDLSAIIREVLARPGWKKGHALALVISGTGKRTAVSFNGANKTAPKLIIELDDPPPNPARVTAVPYTVRLHFAEPDPSVQKGERVFDVALQEKVVIDDLDIVAEAGAALHTVVKELSGIAIGEQLELTLTQQGQRPPILSGIEVVAQ